MSRLTRRIRGGRPEQVERPGLDPSTAHAGGGLSQGPRLGPFGQFSNLSHFSHFRHCSHLSPLSHHSHFSRLSRFGCLSNLSHCSHHHSHSSHSKLGAMTRQCLLHFKKRLDTNYLALRSTRIYLHNNLNHFFTQNSTFAIYSSMASSSSSLVSSPLSYHLMSPVPIFSCSSVPYPQLSYQNSCTCT